MAVPTYDKFIEPLLRYLAQHPEGARARDAHEAAAAALGLSDADRQELLLSGTQPIYKNRAGWAHDRLKRAGLSSSPGRGFWRLTDRGREYVQRFPDQLSPQELERLALGYIDVRLRPPTDDGASAQQPGSHEPSVAPPIVSATASPDDRLAEALSEIKRTVMAEILEALSAVSPSFFETIVLDLLHRMGYGASRADLQRVGGTGDGGIDGVISLDRLGLEKVLVQAKRWQETVGRPQIQAFYGALAGQRASKGVFITTSRFTEQAVSFARSVEGIVLVDGTRLAELMIDHDVGVQARTVRVPKLDSDYFEEFA